MPFCATLVVAALGLCWAQQVRGDIQIPLPNHECCKVYTAFLQKEVPKMMSADKSLDAAEARAAATITWDSRNPNNCIYGYLGACLNPASNQSLEVWAMPRGATHAAFSPSVERSSAQISSIACARAQKNVKEHIAGNLAGPTDDRRRACADRWAVWAAETKLDWPTGTLPPTAACDDSAYNDNEFQREIRPRLTIDRHCRGIGAATTQAELDTQGLRGGYAGFDQDSKGLCTKTAGCAYRETPTAEPNPARGCTDYQRPALDGAGGWKDWGDDQIKLSWSCENYAKQGLCTPAGGYGCNWELEAGVGSTFRSFRRGHLDGEATGQLVDATEACCACGGGKRVDTTPLHHCVPDDEQCYCDAKLAQKVEDMRFYCVANMPDAVVSAPVVYTNGAGAQQIGVAWPEYDGEFWSYWEPALKAVGCNGAPTASLSAAVAAAALALVLALVL